MAVYDKTSQLNNEECLVVELEQLGVRYLSHQSSQGAEPLHTPEQLLAKLVQQPSSRVRTALIALLLAHPDYSEYVPEAIKILPPEQAQTLKFFYTAAFLLQQEYVTKLQPFLGNSWRWLPDLFSSELKLAHSSPKNQLDELAGIQAEFSQMQLNWKGTYDNAARHLLRHWKIEQTWNRSHP
jgi:hypothetical protein